jgi:hypothetical protein
MPMLHSLIKVAAKPIPAVISPKTHAVLDYVSVGIFLAGAGLFWRYHKRAAIAATLCGGARLAVSLMTDRPGVLRRRREIRFQNRRQIDLGVAAMTATMPEFLGFKDEPQRNFFRAQGALITAVNELTVFPESSTRAKKYSKAA